MQILCHFIQANWATTIFGIHRGPRNQSPTDTKRQLFNYAHIGMPHGALQVSKALFIFPFLCNSDWIMSIVLSSNSLIFFFSCPVKSAVKPVQWNYFNYYTFQHQNLYLVTGHFFLLIVSSGKTFHFMLSFFLLQLYFLQCWEWNPGLSAR